MGVALNLVTVHITHCHRQYMVFSYSVIVGIIMSVLSNLSRVGGNMLSVY